MFTMKGVICSDKPRTQNYQLFEALKMSFSLLFWFSAAFWSTVIALPAKSLAAAGSCKKTLFATCPAPNNRQS